LFTINGDPFILLITQYLWRLTAKAVGRENNTVRMRIDSGQLQVKGLTRLTSGLQNGLRQLGVGQPDFAEKMQVR
jgi:hypothetical protein